MAEYDPETMRPSGMIEKTVAGDCATCKHEMRGPVNDQMGQEVIVTPIFCVKCAEVGVYSIIWMKRTDYDGS
jgi:hypothetical protein